MALRLRLRAGLRQCKEHFLALYGNRLRFAKVPSALTSGPTLRLLHGNHRPLNVANTVRGLFSVTVQVVPATRSQPFQPPKVENVVCVAVSVIWAPPGKVPWHGFPDVGVQLIPAGLLVTEPDPVPLRIMLSPTDDGRDVNVTVTIFAVPAVMVTVQVCPVAESHPLHAPNAEFVPGVAVSVTGDPTL